MTGLTWKLNRLRVMGAQEIAHRGLQWASQKLEKIRVASGRGPVPSCLVRPRLSLFPRVEKWQEIWATYYRIERESLDELIQGRIGFFGHAPLDVGRPVDWHRDPVTGIRAPLRFGKSLNYRDDDVVGNVKFVWELGRHQHLIPLAVAYAYTGEHKYLDAVCEQIDGWINDNPYGLGIHWCSALELALRLISWSMVHSLLALRDGSDGLFAAVSDRERLGLAIYQQAKFVRNYLSRYSSANNHLIGELTGLWVATQVFDLGSEGERWAKQAQQELEREARLQVHEDGVDKEQAFYYHLWVLEYLLFAWLVGERSGIPFSVGFRERIAAMAEFLSSVMPPGGQPPQAGDADDGFVTRFESRWPRNPYQDVLAASAAVFRPDGLFPQNSQIPQKAFWYAMIMGKLPVEVATNNMAVTLTAYPRIYRNGGYAVLGSGTAHLVFDAGPLGYPSIAAHGHSDALSFCLALAGEWWLVDPGTYAYHSEQGWRDYFRGTSAHNTVVVDGRNQSEIAGPFLWLRHANARIIDSGVAPDGSQWVTGGHDGYQGLGIAHQRRIELCPTGDQIIIADQIHGEGIHELAVYFHFAPELLVTSGPREGVWQVTKPGSPRRLLFEVDGACEWDAVRGSEAPILGWYSPGLGIKIPASTLRGRWQGRLPTNFVTRLTITDEISK